MMLGSGDDSLFVALSYSLPFWLSDCGSARLLLLVIGWFEPLWQTGSSCEAAAVAFCGWSRDTGWISVVGASRASSSPTGRVGLRFTAVLNSPWESSVMDSLEPQHTLALCVRGSWTFSHTRTHTLLVTQVSFFALLCSLYPCGKLSLHRKPWCYHGRSITCVLLSLHFSICVLLRRAGESWCGWMSHQEN